ncbi:MAG TPA: UDP-N-acetylmuramoyl-tripeptide--D-alanyl-D-alanine ligase [Acidimicrobiia bacterium]|nr:UDP-N-acetylmuramoyl-tripeptide--D-alanyl-D-alanine ligase [Acidimicrobiia bacterium]
MELSAREIAALVGGEVAAGDADARANSFAIDSRALEPGGCFVALVAARDGHDFVGDAARRGARVALVARTVPDDERSGLTTVLVADPLDALGRLGAHARREFEHAAVVGITGSAGKTGTKDLTAAALGGGGSVHASPGSYNNEAGVPLTLLAAPRDVDAVVLEMGARARGDIAALCAIARPRVGVITNVGLAHAGPLGGPEGVAQAKGELFEALPADGLGVLDADDAASAGIAARTDARVLLVSARGTAAADVRADAVTLDGEVRPRFTIHTPWGSGAVRLAVHGEHQVVNALLAATVALDHGVPFAAAVAGLESVRPAAWRMEVLHTPSGAVVLHDAYNANPASTEAALRALAQVDTNGRRVAVLGEMRELGPYSEPEHARIGHLVAALGIDVLVSVGPETTPLAAAAHADDAAIDVHQVADAPGALDAVRSVLGADDAVLVKGSRAVGLESVAQALSATAEGQS